LLQYNETIETLSLKLLRYKVFLQNIEMYDY
jgi:hypothetical protein